MHTTQIDGIFNSITTGIPFYSPRGFTLWKAEDKNGKCESEPKIKIAQTLHFLVENGESPLVSPIDMVLQKRFIRCTQNSHTKGWVALMQAMELGSPEVLIQSTKN